MTKVQKGMFLSTVCKVKSGYRSILLYIVGVPFLCVYSGLANANNVPRSDPGSRHALSEGDRLESETEPFQPSQAQQEH